MSDPAADAVRCHAESLIGLYASRGYSRIDPPVLQPADAVLDVYGEHLQRRIFLTSDAEGHELCLRPDLTIPVCRHHLAQPPLAPADYCYLGSVFRFRPGVCPEFLQAGVESFGRTDTLPADAQTLALALETTAHYGIAAPRIVTGDAGLFAIFIQSLPLADGWKRRLIKDFLRPQALDADLASLSSLPTVRSGYQGLLAALQGADAHAARSLIADLLSISGISTVGGRSVDEIADRFLEQAMLGDARPDASLLDQVRSFLSLSGTPAEVMAGLRPLSPLLAMRLEERLDAFSDCGIDASTHRFSTAFGRGMDYYSGFVFELYDPSGSIDGQLVAGGRYDGLLGQLGAPTPVPAVGFAVWLSRLYQAGGLS